MAHKKGQGSTKNNRDSESKRLGVKIFGGQTAIPGNIIIRQRGTRVHPGRGVGMGKDHTIFAMDEGIVTFTTKLNNKRFVHVLPIEERMEVKGLSTTENTVKEAKKKTTTPKEAKADDLTKIEGVGSKIAALLKKAVFASFDALAKAKVDQLNSVLEAAGSRYQMHNPTTWPKQAKLAADGKWEELTAYQDILDGGLEPSSEEE